MYILTLQHAIGFSLKWLVRRVLPWAEKKKMKTLSQTCKKKEKKEEEKRVLHSTKKKKTWPREEKNETGSRHNLRALLDPV